MERIQKIIADSGYCSRRKAEDLIAAGRVRLNGNPVVLGQSADRENDILQIDGISLSFQNRFRYIMLHKPRGFVTTCSDEKERKTVLDLVRIPERIYPVGRLDMMSEGLLILTNDGAFANQLMHPAYEQKKEYLLRVRFATTDQLEKLHRQIIIDGYQIAEPEIHLLSREGDQALLRVGIHEGRNRQIRRMCAAAGLTVLRLKRVSEGPLRLGSLKAGAWRDLTEQEIQAVRNGNTETLGGSTDEH